ncbi:MAG: hypothetical protein K2W94_08650 [Alphaproteobacteria bacterium]|nr:hypothetical protein [Alphaproteobacteria bacterium]
MEYVFSLYHIHELPDGEEDVKLIGIYTSYEEAEAAKNRVKDKPGFKDYPEDFSIEPQKLNRDSWVEGFISWDEMDKAD